MIIACRLCRFMVGICCRFVIGSGLSVCYRLQFQRCANDRFSIGAMSVIYRSQNGRFHTESYPKWPRHEPDCFYGVFSNIVGGRQLADSLKILQFLSVSCRFGRCDWGITGSFCAEFTGHRWIPLTKASDAELWSFLWSICTRINDWVNNREAGDLRRQWAHYDVIVMSFAYIYSQFSHKNIHLIYMMNNVGGFSFQKR